MGKGKNNKNLYNKGMGYHIVFSKPTPLFFFSKKGIIKLACFHTSFISPYWYCYCY